MSDKAITSGAAGGTMGCLPSGGTPNGLSGRALRLVRAPARCQRPGLGRAGWAMPSTAAGFGGEMSRVGEGTQWTRSADLGRTALDVLTELLRLRLATGRPDGRHMMFLALTPVEVLRDGAIIAERRKEPEWVT